MCGSIVLLMGCASAAPAASPTPAIDPVITQPFPGYALATPPARLHDAPGGTPGPVLPRGTAVSVVGVTVTPDGQVWYRVTTSGDATGWLPAPALSLVPDASLPTPTPLATLAPPPPRTRPTATPRPLVVAGSGQGLFLRDRPGSGQIIRSYPDGTKVVPLGDETRLEGRRWLKVRAPDGREGWMAAEYLRPDA